MNNHKPAPSAILLIHCLDRRGLVASVTDFIYKNKGNILHLDQHVDAQEKVFFMRIEWDLAHFEIPEGKIGSSFDRLLAKKFNMQWELHFSYEKPKVAIFVSKLSHCLYDILSHYQSKDWMIDIPLIISNHQDLKPAAKRFGIDYHYIPVSKNNKQKQERKQLLLLKKHHIDFIILARYMQILTEGFIQVYPHRIINIHHSFLPAFPGAKPYHSAYQRGVKIIGATSHYVTRELDAGPIIEQDVVRVSHKDAVDDLIRKGQDLEKMVLSRAIWYHLKRKILVYNNKTVIFE